MAKKTVADIDVSGKTVLVRVDFNVPQDEAGAITDDRRIRMALPTISKILEGGGKVVLMSHLGRPGGKGFEEKFSLAPVAKKLEDLLGRSVTLASDTGGSDSQAKATSGPGGFVATDTAPSEAPDAPAAGPVESNTTTRRPACARCQATEAPTMPAPMTATSYPRDLAKLRIPLPSGETLSPYKSAHDAKSRPKVTNFLSCSLRVPVIVGDL